MAMPGTLHQVIAFIIVGLMFIAMSFAYQWLSQMIEEDENDNRKK